MTELQHRAHFDRRDHALGHLIAFVLGATVMAAAALMIVWLA